MGYIIDDLFTFSRQRVDKSATCHRVYVCCRHIVSWWLFNGIAFVRNEQLIISDFSCPAVSFITLMKQLICQHWKVADDRQGHRCALRLNHFAIYGLITLIWRGNGVAWIRCWSDYLTVNLTNWLCNDIFTVKTVIFMTVVLLASEKPGSLLLVSERWTLWNPIRHVQYQDIILN